MPDFETDERPPESLWMRLVWVILVAILISFANTVQAVLAVLQFIIMVLNKGKPNKNLAEFGTSLGLWFAKAVRYQTAASQSKPWPWSELD